MYRYVMGRLVQSALLVVAVITLAFVFIQMAPGDPVLYLYGMHTGNGELIKTIRHEWGLDRPLWQQYATYVHNLLISRNLGYSLINQQPVGQIIGAMMPNTLLLMIPSVLIAALVGTLLGALAARSVSSWVDYTVGAFSLVGYSTPPFWLGIIFIIVFASKLHWLPTAGMATVGVTESGFAQWLDTVRHMVLPLGVLVWWYVAAFARLTRAAVLDETVKPYLTTARMKGLSEARVLVRHALRNAAKPVLTVFGLYLGTMFAGAVMTEVVFAWPGMGRLLFNSIIQHDYPVMLGTFIVIGVAVVLANLMVDLSYVVLDPRVRYR